LATSDIHLQYKLKITRDQCVDQAVAAVKHAKSLCEEVEFSPEDSGRSDKDFLCKVLSAVIEAGATTLNIPDTVGYNTPQEYFDIISYLIKNTVGSDKVIWSTHCHNDLGLATANTLAGVSAGARQVEVTINGIGERAGNTSFEEVAMALFVHPDRYPVTSTHIDTTQIYSVSKLVSQYTGMAVQANKAIVGANAFAHESGIHQDGVLKHQQTYEIISPATVGVPSNSLVLGKHSGRNAFKTHLAEMGYKDLSDEQIQATFTRFKALADSKKKVTDQDLVALLEDQVRQPEQVYRLGALQVTSANENNATATVSILKQVGGAEHLEETTDAAVGNGPVDAIFKAIMRIIGLQFQLQYFEVKSVTEDTDALGTSVVKIIPITPSNGLGSGDSGVELDQQTRLNKSSPPTFRGQGTDPDILRASAKAYIHAVNRVIAEKENVNSPRYIGQGP
jgi:2-isopropylmalate synthase